jgi:lipopolysaccharide export system protein LptC
MEQDPGLHTRAVAVLKVGLPLIAVALLFSVFLLRPSEDRGGEIIFSEADLDQLGQGLQISNPTFTGTTGAGDRFRFTADLVEPDAAPPTRASITHLDGEIDFEDGLRMEISAEGGDLEIPDQILDLAGSVKIRTSEGYDLQAERLSVDLAKGVIDGGGAVEGDGPLGRINSGTIHVAPTASGNDIRRFSFGNGVRVIYDPAESGAEPTETP